MRSAELSARRCSLRLTIDRSSESHPRALQQPARPWNVRVAGLPELWAETLGEPDICIAVLDGPVDRSHASLASANLARLETLVRDDAMRGAASQHGTHVASVIFGSHDGPMKGVAPGCRGLIVPVFRGEHAIQPCSQLDLARAITQAVQAGARVINISGGELSVTGAAHPILADAIRYCAARNVLIVTAAGNDGCECLHVPGALPSVLVVGAMNSEGLPLPASNWGTAYRQQGILAPGEHIPGAVPGAGIALNSGTSYAAPIVSGVAALLLSVQVKLGHRPNPHGVRRVILDTAIGCEGTSAADCRRLLAGRLNIAGAMNQVLNEGGAMSNSEIVQSSRPLVGDAGERERPSGQPTAAAGDAQPIGPAPYPPAEPVALRGPGLAPPPSDSRPVPAPASNRVRAAGCGCPANSPCTCGAAITSPQLVFALGTLAYDFGTEARRDSIVQHMADPRNPYDPNRMLEHLETNSWDAAAIIWTLNMDATPIYAIQAHGPFASDIYKRLREFLAGQSRGDIERVSVPGLIVGSVRLFNGQVVPSIWPELRGMYSWNTDGLVQAVVGAAPAQGAPSEERDDYTRRSQNVADFLRRVYDGLRNLGVTPQERAMNYAATNAFQIGEVFGSAIREGLDLDTIDVQRSPICRPESECWDVLLTFFNPRKVFEQARKVYRFTVDVSDVVPVMVGSVRSWFVR